MSTAVLQELRARLGLYDTAQQARELLPFPLSPAGGLSRGALAEITGPGKTEAAAALLAENPGLRAAWVESRFSLLPSALPQRRVNLEKIFFVEAGAEAPWAVSAVLRSRLFPIVVYHAPYGEERELRRFQLLAEKAACTMLLLGEAPSLDAWPIRVSLAARGRGARLQQVKGK